MLNPRHVLVLGSSGFATRPAPGKGSLANPTLGRPALEHLAKMGMSGLQRGETCLYVHTYMHMYICMHACIDICTYTSERICEVEFSTHPGVGCLKLAYNNALQSISTVLCTVGLVSISLYVLDLLILGLGERASPVFRNKGCFETRCCSLVLLYIVCCRPSTTLQMVKW